MVLVGGEGERERKRSCALINLVAFGVCQEISTIPSCGLVTEHALGKGRQLLSFILQACSGFLNSISTQFTQIGSRLV